MYVRLSTSESHQDHPNDNAANAQPFRRLDLFLQEFLRQQRNPHILERGDRQKDGKLRAAANSRAAIWNLFCENIAERIAPKSSQFPAGQASHQSHSLGLQVLPGLRVEKSEKSGSYTYRPRVRTWLVAWYVQITIFQKQPGWT